MLKNKATLLVVYSIIMFPIARYFNWNTLLVVFPALYLAIWMTRTFKPIYLIIDACVMVYLGIALYALLNRYDVIAYTLIGIFLVVVLGYSIKKRYAN